MQDWARPFDLGESPDLVAGDILVITPLYPQPDNAYLCAFVHSRMREYRRRGLRAVVVSKAFDGVSKTYDYEGITVLQLSLDDLQTLLRTAHYRTIAIHFIEMDYARVLESCDLSDTRILIWGNGAESLYPERNKFDSPYFHRLRDYSNEERADMAERSRMLARLNDLPNVSAVYVSEFGLRRSNELHEFQWRDAYVIPNLIDPRVFPYREKGPEHRKHVFTVKTHGNTSCYAMDTVVRTIIELSRRPCFADMEFTVAGTGDAHDMLVAPLRQFPNVHLVERFLTHEEIAACHAEAGIGLFPTRFDVQGVSMCEAALSGLAVVSTRRDSVNDFLAGEEGLLAEVDDFTEYADIIERLYNDPAYFLRASKASHDKVARVCSMERTVEREVALLQEGVRDRRQNDPGAAALGVGDAAPALTVAVLNPQPGALEAWRRLQALPGFEGLEVVGALSVAHALSQARGTYLKLMRSQDFCHPGNLPHLLGLARTSSAEVLLSDCLLLERGTARATAGERFDFMCAGQRYPREDLAWPGYGFDGRLPGERPAAVRVDTLRRMGKEQPGALADGSLMEVAANEGASYAYLPEEVWHFRGVEAAQAVDVPSEQRERADEPQRARTTSTRFHALARRVLKQAR